MTMEEIIDSISYSWRGDTGRYYADIAGKDIYSNHTRRKVEMFIAELKARLMVDIEQEKE